MKFFDLHCDTAYKCYRDNLYFTDNTLAVTPQKAADFDVWYQCFAVFIKDGTKQPFEYYKNTVENFKKLLKNCPDNLTPIFTVEGGALIEKDLGRIETMYRDGIRALTLTWNGENQIAGGADTDAPLKEFGRQVIHKLNRLSIATDLSHLNKKSFYGAIEIAEKPIITHSCLECINSHRRNIDDNQLKLLVQKGGVFGLCFYPAFLGEGDVLENVYKNIFHVLDLGYEDYLSMGSDFDGADMSCKLYDISAVPKLYSYLKSRNINEDILDKIFFQNAYNFFNSKKGE